MSDFPGDIAGLKEAREVGCCGDDNWRGRLCQYHQGYADGYDRAIDDLMEIDADGDLENLLAGALALSKKVICDGIHWANFWH